MAVPGSLEIVQGETLEFRTLLDLNIRADGEIHGLVFGDGLVAYRMHFFHLLRGGGDGNQTLFIDSVHLLQYAETVIASIERLRLFDQFPLL